VSLTPALQGLRLAS